jgi:hypothetical protein
MEIAKNDRRRANMAMRHADLNGPHLADRGSHSLLGLFGCLILALLLQLQAAYGRQESCRLRFAINHG